MTKKQAACLMALSLGAVAAGLIGCTTEAKPPEVTYYYLPG